jgi:hypothetical protein
MKSRLFPRVAFDIVDEPVEWQEAMKIRTFLMVVAIAGVSLPALGSGGMGEVEPEAQGEP